MELFFFIFKHIKKDLFLSNIFGIFKRKLLTGNDFSFNEKLCQQT